MLESLKEKISEFRHKHEHALELAFFVGGFAFDAFMVGEVDDPIAICQQAVYLIIIACLIHFELLFRMHKWKPEGRLAKLWDFRTLLLHFLLGTLLNIYSLFYIKSASLLNSLIFLMLMVGMILANELPMIKRSKVSFKIGLFAICLFSYFSILYPVILGFVGWTPFLLAVATTLLVFYLQLRWLQRSLPDRNTLFRTVLLPGVSVLMVFVVFYIMGWIPPVPLSVKVQGVYHMIEKKGGEYLLSTEKPWWKFWQSGDQDFVAQPGDKIYFYAQIYSPARFSDQVYVRFSWHSPKSGWQPADRIPLNIVGGRKEGYRGYAMKSNYQPGSWRIQVETAIGLEISRLYFDVTTAPAGEPRQFQVIAR